MRQLSITEAHIYGLFIQSIFFGVYLVTVGYTIPPLVSTGSRLRRLAEVNWPMLLGALALFIFIALDMALSFYHVLLAFIFYDGPGGAAAVYSDISSWINVTKLVNVLSETVVGDLMLIYRCWIVYNRAWLIVIGPLVFWLGCIACEIRMLYLAGTLRSSALVSSAATFPYHAAFWGISVIVNIVTTTLLIWRLWSIDRKAAQYRATQTIERETILRHVMRVILESGLIYTASAVATFITVVAKSTASYPITALAISSVGIAFNLIIIRSVRREKSISVGSTSVPTNGTIPLHIMVTRQQGRLSTAPEGKISHNRDKDEALLETDSGIQKINGNDPSENHSYQ